MTIPHTEPRGVEARVRYQDALKANPFLDHASRNSYEREIALAEWEDAHNGLAVGFREPKPRWTARDDVGHLPFRVLHWGDDGRVRAQDFWTGNRAHEFAKLHTDCSRQVAIRHYAPWDPPRARQHNPCWNGGCVLRPCGGIVHSDAAGRTWEQPQGTVYNPDTQLHEWPSGR